MVENSGTEPPIEVRRIRQRRKVSLFMGDAKTPLIGYAANLSMSGMFVELPDPPLPTSVLRFEMVVAGGFEIIRGRAQVVWIRRETAAEPAGLGLRLFKLDSRATKTLRHLVEEQVSQQDSVANRELRDVVGMTLSSAEPTLDSNGNQMPPPRRRGRATAIFSFITIGAVIVVTALLVVPSRLKELGPVGRWIQKFSSSAGGGEINPGDPGPMASEWARAWSDQRIEELLTLYSREFRTADQRGWRAWEDDRRSRVAQADRIEIGSVETGFLETGRAELKFDYRTTSGDGSESTHTTTWLLIVEDDLWKILEERSEP